MLNNPPEDGHLPAAPSVAGVDEGTAAVVEEIVNQKFQSKLIEIQANKEARGKVKNKSELGFGRVSSDSDSPQPQSQQQQQEAAVVPQEIPDHFPAHAEEDCTVCTPDQ